MARMKVTILGCGSSGGVPRLGGNGAQWGECDPAEPRNRRRRCSLLVERIDEGGTTRALIDTSPDLREQLLGAGAGWLDAVVYTHSHADHVHGLDDLRAVVMNMQARLPVWADAPTAADLRARFGYAFDQVPGSLYPPILDLRPITGAFAVSGPGGDIEFLPIKVGHGPAPALGFRIHDLAYMPDVLTIPDASWPLLEGLQVWILDALRRTPHPTHAHLSLALEWTARMRPAQAVLTNMHIDLDYAALCAELAPHIRPAYDGMTLEWTL